MPVVYITEQGACICKKGERIIVEKEGKELLEIELFKVRSLLLFGYVQITTQAVRQLLRNEIETAFLSMDGDLLGRLTPVAPKNVFLRIHQVRCFDDTTFSLETAKAIVEAKISNAVVLLSEFQRNHAETDMKGAIEALRGVVLGVSAATAPESLLGIEGNAASVYWEAFGKMCRGEMEFRQRVKRPPTDPVNSLLSFGYSLVFGKIQGLLEAVGLDPYIGFFHQPHYGRPSLAADVLEEFRSPLVDRFTLSLVNKRIMSSTDFEPHEESGGIRMTRDGMRKYLGKFEEYIGKKLAGFDDTALDFSRLLRRQVERLSKAIERREKYSPFRMTLR
jgi:CRISP-associated protein Cas1